MALFERVHMPSFAGATEWLNSEPLGPAELEGHVVLVNFWTRVIPKLLGLPEHRQCRSHGTIQLNTTVDWR
jgi:hypothetical protein